MAGVQHNAGEVAARFYKRSERVQKAVSDELLVQAQVVAAALRARIAKDTSAAANTINVEDTSPEAKTVIVASEHAWYIEHGVKPGGKGLPRFFDPASADIVGWLQRRLRGGARSPERGSRAFQSINLALRDAYEGLAWHIRHFGVKAQPFVEPTVRELAAPVAAALKQAVMAAMTDGAAPASATGSATTWREFLSQNMGAEMQAARAGGASHKEAHGTAIRNIAARWKARKS